MRLYLLLTFALTLACCANKRNPRVIIVTDFGNIEAEVNTDKAPVTATNFLRYVDSGKYNNLACFYRVVRLDNQPDKKIKIEVIQGGFGQDSLIEKYEFPPIIHETTQKTGILHKDGVLSMARYGPGTASSEFFICVGDQPALDFNGGRNSDKQGFAAFGKVVKGMDIVRKIQLLKDKDQYLEKPLKIISITRIKE
jgi:peptidyl-prolyl cis-trans isomerase A (cyclophilin A)